MKLRFWEREKPIPIYVNVAEFESGACMILEARVVNVEALDKQYAELENLRAFKRQVLAAVEKMENHPEEECSVCKRKRESRDENHG